MCTKLTVFTFYFLVFGTRLFKILLLTVVCLTVSINSMSIFFSLKGQNSRIGDLFNSYSKQTGGTITSEQLLTAAVRSVSRSPVSRAAHSTMAVFGVLCNATSIFKVFNLNSYILNLYGTSATSLSFTSFSF